MVIPETKEGNGISSPIVLIRFDGKIILISDPKLLPAILNHLRGIPCEIAGNVEEIVNMTKHARNPDLVHNQQSQPDTEDLILHQQFE